MEQKVSGKRLTETWPGRLASVLLALLWLASMGMVDTNAYSMYPMLLGLGAVMLLVLSGMLMGGRTIRLGWLTWGSLAVALYFLVRCLCSYAIVEAWRESALIVSCCVFYVAGVYGAQSRRGGLMLAALCAAVLLNVIYFAWEPAEMGLIRWTGRPEVGLAGENSHPVALFAYKNHACAFIMISAAALLCCGAWCVQSRFAKLFCILVALAGLAISFECHSRACYALVPPVVIGIWVMQLVLWQGEGRRMGWPAVIGGITIACGLLILLVEMIWGQGLAVVADVDTHLRAKIWKSILQVMPQAPLWGYGSMGAHWEILNVFDEWHTPNMAHNEYLQVWADYGIIGLLLILALPVLHTLAAFHALGRGEMTPWRRRLVAVALLVIWCAAVVSIFDFMLHLYALAVLVAYCLGVLASPYAYVVMRGGRNAERKLVPVRGQRIGGRALLALVLCGVIGYVVWMSGQLHEPWHAQWKIDELSVPGQDDDARKRHALLAQMIQQYPDPALADFYFYMPVYGDSVAEQEAVLRTALDGNPKQGYTRTMLAHLLTQQGRFSESEMLLRQYYPQEGMPAKMTSNWPFYYYNNLMRWSWNELNKGNVAGGLSKAEYALNLRDRVWDQIYAPWGHDKRDWNQNGGGHSQSELRKIQKQVAHDAALLRRLGVQKDDSWMQPMEPGGKTALYPQWGLVPKSEEKKGSK